jgi:hypothetical protein
MRTALVTMLALSVLLLGIVLAVVLLESESPPSTRAERAGDGPPVADAGPADVPDETGDATLVGRVVSFTYEPVAGRTVLVEQGGSARDAAPSDARGFWGLAGLRAGRLVHLSVRGAGMVALPSWGCVRGRRGTWRSSFRVRIHSR